MPSYEVNGLTTSWDPDEQRSQSFPLRMHKQPHKLKEISATIGDDDFRKTLQKWKETTSTSPSGRHLGHYKTALLLDDDILQLHVDMLNIPQCNL
jgi:hypothetical protein